MQLKAGAPFAPNDTFNPDGNGLFTVAGSWIEGMRQRMRASATRRALAGLDDHTLKDIGVPRLDIDWVARTTADGKLRRAA